MKGNGRERKGKAEGSADAEWGDPGVLAPQGCGAPASPIQSPQQPHRSPGQRGACLCGHPAAAPPGEGARGTWSSGSAAGARGSPPAREGPFSPSLAAAVVPALLAGVRAHSPCSRSSPAPRFPRWQEPPCPSPCPAGIPQQSPQGPKRWLPPPSADLPCLPQGCRRDGAAEPWLGAVWDQPRRHGPWAHQTRYPCVARASPRITGANSQWRPGVPNGLTREQRDTRVRKRSGGGPGKTPPTQLAAHWPKI